MRSFWDLKTFLSEWRHRQICTELSMSKSNLLPTGLVGLACATLIASPAFASLDSATPTQVVERGLEATDTAWKPWRMRIELREGRFIRSSRSWSTRVECETALEREIVHFVATRRSARAGQCVADGLEA